MPNQKTFKFRKIFNPGNLIILVLGIISCLLWFRVYEAYSRNPGDKGLSVTFLNVGQGESILLRTPEGKSILIDGGACPKEWSTFDAGEEVVVPYLRENRIKKLDMVIATHPDLDHIGGLLAVLKYFPTDMFLDSGTVSTTQTYEDLLKIVEKKNIQYKIAKREEIKLEPRLVLKILSPISLGFMDDPNNNSIVIKLTYGNISFLFTGDIGELAEELYVREYGKELNSHIFKAAHHGSDSSSSRLFLEYVGPEIAIISAGKNNQFGHPHKAVLDRLGNMNIPIYRTDILGHITITTDGEKYEIASH